MSVSLPKMMSSQSPGGRAYIQPVAGASAQVLEGGRGAPSCSVSGLGLGPAALVPDSLLPKLPKFNALQEVTTRLGSEGSLRGPVLRGSALGFRARLGAREHSGPQS